VEKMFKEFSNKIVFIGISQDDKGKVEDFVKKFELSFPVVHNAGKSIMSSFNARIPSYILIDVQGRIRYIAHSLPEVSDLEKILK